MPALIPTNTFISKNVQMPNIQSQFQHYHPQSLPHQPLYKFSPTDEKLHKDLDDQIELVKKIQQILGTEQMKLEIMLQEFHTRNMKRKQIIQSHLAKASENPNSHAKRLRICSPYSINRNMSVKKN